MLSISDWNGERPVREGSQVVLHVRVQRAEQGGWLPAYHTMYSLAASGGRAIASFTSGRFAAFMTPK